MRWPTNAKANSNYADCHRLIVPDGFAGASGLILVDCVAVTVTDSKTAVVWFRSDLRLHDNPTLAAAADADRVLPVYAVDPRRYGEQPYRGDNSFTYRKTGPHRVRFLLDSLRDLRSSLREQDSELVVDIGRPETVVSRVAAAVDADVVHCSTYPTTEEIEVEVGVREALHDSGTDVDRHWTHTLHHILDLPDQGRSVDDTFTPFKDHVESAVDVRPPIEPPSMPPVPSMDGLEAGTIPAVTDLLDREDPRQEPDDRGALPFEGGESRGLKRLQTYVWERDKLREYKQTRNGLLGADYSSKLSPWLNHGCLSPRRVHEEVTEYERERIENESTYWLLFELRWRDFFQFQFIKHQGKHFTRDGIRERTDIDWADDPTVFERWKRGETGVPFVDAAMRELNATGYLSNRARQNAASFLANDLRIDWRKGAAYFETQLVDYDPCSNYGNWAYIAGVGSDSRNRSFNVKRQAKQYDESAEYVKTWCPELDTLPPEYAREPWRLSPDQQQSHELVLGEDYPKPVIDPDAVYGKAR